MLSGALPPPSYATRSDLLSAHDCNTNGRLDVCDVRPVLVSDTFRAPPPGWTFLGAAGHEASSGVVDALLSPGAPADVCIGDLNRDGFADGDDIAAFVMRLQRQTRDRSATVSVSA